MREANRTQTGRRRAIATAGVLIAAALAVKPAQAKVLAVAAQARSAGRDAQAAPAVTVGARQRVVHGCVGPSTGGGSVSAVHDDGISTFKWKLSGCEATVRMEGDVELSDDFRGIAGVSPGGSVRIEAREGGVERSLVIGRGSSGLTYEYRRDGRPEWFEGEGREWLAGFLEDLYRVTGYAAEGRAGWLLSQGGPAAVFDEVGLLRTDLSRRAYLRYLAGAGVDASRVLTAAAGIGSDHELAELLLEIVDGRGVSPATEGGYLRALDTIDSSFEYARVAEALMRRRAGGRP